MKSETVLKIKEHKLWLDSVGGSGKKIYLEDEIIEGGSLENISLSQGGLINCTFKEMTLKQGDFYAAMLCSSSFEDVLIKLCEFVKAELSYTKFLNAKLENSNFSKADFSDSNFENVNIENCKFENTLLYNVCFKNVCFKNIDFRGAYIENVVFNKQTIIKDIYGLDFIHIKSVNIGSLEKPVYLNEREAKQWLRR